MKWVKYGLVHLTILLTAVFMACLAWVLVQHHQEGFAGIVILLFMCVVIFFSHALNLDEKNQG